MYMAHNRDGKGRQCRTMNRNRGADRLFFLRFPGEEVDVSVEG